MKKISILLIMILIFGTGIHITYSTPISTDVSAYSDYYLVSDDEGFGVNITHLNADGSDTLPINGIDRITGNETTTYLKEGNALVFTPEMYSDWVTNPSSYLNITGMTLDVEFEFPYPAPWTIDSNSIPLDGPPALFWPVIPYGNETYYNEFETDITSMSGYSITEDSTYFRIHFSNSTVMANITYEKSNGLMYNYTYDGPIASDSGTIPFELQLERSFILSPSHTSTIDWPMYDPLIDYIVAQAELNNGTDRVYFGANDNPDENPIYADGYMEQGQIANIGIGEIRDFENRPGYMMELSTSTGEIGFNISIELPSRDLNINNLFLYPMFIATDPELGNAYFEYANAASDNYSTYMHDDLRTLNYTDQYETLQASWNMTSGFMQTWEYHETGGDGVNIRLELLSAVSLSGLGLHWGVSAGDGATYDVKTATINGGNLTLDDSDASGYISSGDQIYIEVLSTGAKTDDGPPPIAYKLNATHGHEDNFTIEYPYPGSTDFDGPPMFLPHHLLGNDHFLQWVEGLYTTAGADYDLSTSNIILNWTISNGGITLNMDVAWRKSDGVLIYYHSSSSGGNDTFELEFIHVADSNLLYTPPSGGNGTNTTTNTTSTTSSTTAAFQLPAYSGYVSLMILIAAIPVIRRRSKTTN